MSADRLPLDATVQAATDVALAGRRPAVAAHDAWLASGLETVLPGTVLMCIQRSSAIDTLRSRGVDVFCLSEHRGPQAVAGASSVDLFQDPAAVDFVRRMGPLVVVGFKPSERLRAAVAAAGAVLVGGDDRCLATARTFENKLAFVEIAARAGVPTPLWEVLRGTGELDFESLAARLGPTLVVQAARGNAGQRTYFVGTQADLAVVAAAEGAGPLRVAALVEGPPFTCSAVAGGEGLVASIEACAQVTGVSWLTPMRLGSCGNAWPGAGLAAVGDDVGDIMSRLAGALADGGYRGVFGVDFVNGPGGPVVIEANPRMVASLPVATQLEAAAGRVPLLVHHLLEGLAGDSLGAAPGDHSRALPPGSQLIVHRLPGDASPRPDVRSGVYRLLPGHDPEWLREGCWLEDVAAEDEALVLVREAAEPVTAGKEFARIYTRSGHGDAHPGIREAVALLRGRPLP